MISDSRGDIIGDVSGSGACRFFEGAVRASLAIALLWPPSASADGGARVQGRVLEEWTHRPLPGWTVAVDRQSATTDADGRFAIAHAPATYDLLVADPDRACVTVYVGLRRRDPALEHRSCLHEPHFVHAGALRGTLSGGGSFPLTTGSVSVQFSSAQASGMDGRYAGPAQRSTEPPDTASYGPIAMRWEGPASIRGEIVALRRTPLEVSPPPGPPPASGTCPPLPARPTFKWAFERREVEVLAGQAVTADLPLREIPSFKITLKIVGDLRNHASNWKSSFRQLWPKVPEIILDSTDRGGSRADPFSYDLSVPDLRATGAALCVDAGQGYISSQHCWIAPGETVTLTGDPPPVFTAPANNDVLTPTTRFAWQSNSSEHGVYALVFDVWSPAPGYPRVKVVTAARSTTWPDLRALGIAFPALRRAFPEGNAAYKCMVGLLQPYASMDDATGPEGIGAPLPKDRRQSFSENIALRAPSP